jgi:hypothetical protein
MPKVFNKLLYAMPWLTVAAAATMIFTAGGGGGQLLRVPRFKA